jgi:hypothetical protein
MKLEQILRNISTTFGLTGLTYCSNVDWKNRLPASSEETISVSRMTAAIRFT